MTDENDGIFFDVLQFSQSLIGTRSGEDAQRGTAKCQIYNSPRVLLEPGIITGTSGTSASLQFSQSLIGTPPPDFYYCNS